MCFYLSFINVLYKNNVDDRQDHLVFSFILLVQEYQGVQKMVRKLMGVFVPQGHLSCMCECFEVFNRSARVSVSWTFVHPVGTHVEDT